MGSRIGVSRILVPLVGKGVLTASRPVPTCVLVAVDAEETRGEAMAIAAKLRARGIPTEVAPKADKFGKQIRYADRRGIPFVWFATRRGQGHPHRRAGARPTRRRGCRLQPDLRPVRRKISWPDVPAGIGKD